MAVEDQKRWDQKHAAGHGGEEPASFLRRVLEEEAWAIPRGLALDVAAGKGRNALYLARRGFAVEAVDISEVALNELRERSAREGLQVICRQVDLDRAELAERRYDLIANFDFLSRPLVPKLRRALKPGGFIVFQTYLIDQREIGHPKNPAYLLRHNELLGLFAGFRVLFYREGKFADAGVTAYRASLVAEKPAAEEQSGPKR